jgi:hypothetical protein
VSDDGETGTDTVLITVLDPAKDPVCISRDTPATASSSESIAHEARYAVDGSGTSRWASVQGNDSEWISIDLGEEKTFQRVVLSWETAYGKEYKIQGSEDGTRWSDIYHETEGNGAIDTIEVTAAARYVRMMGIVRGTQYGYSLYEFEIYTLPLATHNHPRAALRSVTNNKCARTEIFAPDGARIGVNGGEAGVVHSTPARYAPGIYIVKEVGAGGKPPTCRRVPVIK